MATARLGCPSPSLIERPGSPRILVIVQWRLGFGSVGHRQIPKDRATNSHQKRFLSLLAPFACSIEHSPDDRKNVARGGWHVRLRGKVRPGENVSQEGHDLRPYDLRVGIERQTGFLKIEQPRQSRTTHLVPNGRLDDLIKSFPPGSHEACSLDLLDKAGGLTRNQRAK